MKALPTKKKIVFTIIVILSVIAFTARSQKVGLDIQASINHALIPDVQKKPFRNQPPSNSGYSVSIYKPGFKERYKEKVGGKINLGININFTPKLFLRTGIGFSLQRFKRKVVAEETGSIAFGNWPVVIQPLPQRDRVVPNDSVVSSNIAGEFYWGTTQNWERLGEIVRTGNTIILYTDIPLLFGFNFFNKKVNVCAGASTSILTYSIQDAKGIYYEYTTPYGPITTKIIKVKDKSNEGLNNVLFSINSSVTYNVARKISLFSKYSKQLTPLYEKKYQYAGKAKLHSFELGVEFRIR